MFSTYKIEIILSCNSRGVVHNMYLWQTLQMRDEQLTQSVQAEQLDAVGQFDWAEQLRYKMWVRNLCLLAWHLFVLGYLLAQPPH